MRLRRAGRTPPHDGGRRSFYSWILPLGSGSALVQPKGISFAHAHSHPETFHLLLKPFRPIEMFIRRTLKTTVLPFRKTAPQLALSWVPPGCRVSPWDIPLKLSAYNHAESARTSSKPFRPGPQTALITRREISGKRKLFLSLMFLKNMERLGK
ncbi:uncharacterized protein LOC103886348 isoform X1 [Papio anubis]|uniref:uncharacterized protein LOC103886348 isoform X1 n=1 Tax=Papio anubis TaxID=9555 RepID=UPI0012AD3AD7|nr:uncharacterized protein LOC103886348 isoform X1 [Papio anubis]